MFAWKEQEEQQSHLSINDNLNYGTPKLEIGWSYFLMIYLDNNISSNLNRLSELLQTEY